MNPAGIAALVLAASLLSASAQALRAPESDDYPQAKNDPNGLWKPTPAGFWTNAPAASFKAVPDGAPADLSRSQRWKWGDQALLVGTVVKVFDQGILLECAPDTPLFLGFPPPKLPPLPNAPRVYGIFLLKNYVPPHFLGPGDIVRTAAFPGGLYKDVDGTRRRIYDTDIRDF